MESDSGYRMAYYDDKDSFGQYPGDTRSLFVRFLSQNTRNLDPNDLGETQPLLDEIQLTDEEANDLGTLIQRIERKTDSEVPESICKNLRLYLELVGAMGLDAQVNKRELLAHHVSLAISMVILAKNLKAISPGSSLTTMPSTKTQLKELSHEGRQKIVLLSDKIGAELASLLELQRETNSKAQKDGPSQGQAMVVSQAELAQRKFDSMTKIQSYQDELAKIQDTYNKLQTQSDKETLAICKFGLKAAAAIITAILVIFGWIHTIGSNQSTQPGPDSSKQI